MKFIYWMEWWGICISSNSDHQDKMHCFTSYAICIDFHAFWIFCYIVTILFHCHTITIIMKDYQTCFTENVFLLLLRSMGWHGWRIVAVERSSWQPPLSGPCKSIIHSNWFLSVSFFLLHVSLCSNVSWLILVRSLEITFTLGLVSRRENVNNINWQTHCGLGMSYHRGGTDYGDCSYRARTTPLG